MALGSRRRQQPATTANFLHNILTLVGLGATNDADAECVNPITDRISFATQLFDAVGEGRHDSAWLPCIDRALARFTVEYHASSGTRVFLLGFCAHDGRVGYSRPLEPDNMGLATDLIGTNTFKGFDGAGRLEAVDVRGLYAIKLILLAKDAGISVSAWGGVG